MRIWRAVRREGSELGVQPEPRVLPPKLKQRTAAGLKTPQMSAELAGWYLKKAWMLDREGP